MILKLLITRGNITLIAKEATEEREKENFKMQPEKVRREKRIISKMKMTNTTTTRGE